MWQLSLLVIFGMLIILFSTGMPVAFSFAIANVVGIVILLGTGGPGLQQLIVSMFSSVSSYVLLAVVFFILMGEVMFQSGIVTYVFDTVDKWLGRLPGRLSLLSVATGTLLATMTGTSLATVALLGTLLVPEMEKRGYKKPMSLGPILGSAGLALMIPPSGLAVLLGAIGLISVGRILVAIIIPGVLMAALYATYIIIRCRLQPALAPPYEVTPPPLSEKVAATARHILPIGFIIFMVLGVIFLGVATPSEAAATGALGTVLLAASYRRLNWEVMKKSFLGSLRVIFMLLLIKSGATAFAQILAFSGATRGLVGFAVGLPLSPIFILVAMMVLVLFMGTLMESVAIMMICLPIFMPIIHALGFDPVWFAVIFLLNIEMGVRSPPFGLTLFAMKAVAPSDTTMGDCYRAALPFLYLDLVTMILLIAFPAISLWLPSLMF